MKKRLKNNIYIKVAIIIFAAFIGLVLSVGCNREVGLSCDFPYSKSLSVIRDYIYTTYTSLCGGDVLESGVPIVDAKGPENNILPFKLIQV